MEEKRIQLNVAVHPEIKRKIREIGMLTSRSNPADVVSWLVNLKYDELFAPRPGGNGHGGESLATPATDTANGD